MRRKGEKLERGKVFAGDLLAIASRFFGKKKSPVGVPPDCILHDKTKFTKVHNDGRAQWKDKRGRKYVWDALHGEIEVFSKSKVHLGTLDKDGNKIGDGIPGRRLK